MAFRTTSIPAAAFQQAKDRAAQMKRQAQALRSASAAGTVTSSQILGFAEYASTHIETFNEIKAVPGIAQFARDQEDDQSYDVVAEFTAMVSTLTSVRDWIVANFPAQGGFVLAETLNPDGSRTERVFPANQTTDLVTALDALIATIA